jgi:uncharacterized Tic20 family protein
MASDFGANSYPCDYEITADERTWGILAHVSMIVTGLVGLAPLGPFIVWLIYKEKSKFVARHALEALVFSVGAFVFTIVFIIASVVLTCCSGGILGVLMAPVALLFSLAFLAYVVLACIRASERKYFDYPFTTKFVPKN